MKDLVFVIISIISWLIDLSKYVVTESSESFGRYVLTTLCSYLFCTILKFISHYEQTCKGQIHQPPPKKTLMDDISVEQATIIPLIDDDRLVIMHYNYYNYNLIVMQVNSALYYYCTTCCLFLLASLHNYPNSLIILFSTNVGNLLWKQYNFNSSYT